MDRRRNRVVRTWAAAAVLATSVLCVSSSAFARTLALDEPAPADAPKPATSPTPAASPKPDLPQVPVAPAAPRRRSARPAPAPRAPVFDANLIAEDAAKRAIDAARQDHRRLLIVWGEEVQKKPTDMLAALFRLDAMKSAASWEYEVIFAEIGAETAAGPKNLAWAKSLGVPVREKGETRHAVLTVLDLDLKVLANKPLDETIVEFAQGDYYERFVIVPLLESHKAPRPEAQALLDEALAKAKKDGKGVMVRFSEPWCAWCKRFDQVIGQEAVKKALESGYVLVKIDTARNPGGGAVMNTIGGEYIEGIPYFAFLDDTGKVLGRSQSDTTSGKPGTNIGYPTSDEELERLSTLLTSHPTMHKDAIKVVVEAFRAEREKIAAEQNPSPAAPATP